MAADAVTLIKNDNRVTEQLFERMRTESGGGAVQVEQMSREELYEQAKQAQVPGRSSMNKDELADAVRENA